MFEKIIEISIYLITAHFIADFALQNRWMADNKGKYCYIMFAHSIIYAGIICITLNYFNIFHYWKFFALYGTHMIIDQAKCYMYNPKKSEKKNLKYLYIDQASHFVVLFIISIL